MSIAFARVLIVAYGFPDCEYLSFLKSVLGAFIFRVEGFSRFVTRQVVFTVENLKLWVSFRKIRVALALIAEVALWKPTMVRSSNL